MSDPSVFHRYNSPRSVPAAIFELSGEAARRTTLPIVRYSFRNRPVGLYRRMGSPRDTVIRDRLFGENQARSSQEATGN